MNNNQRAQLDACNRVNECNTKFATEFATIPEFAIEKTEFEKAFAIVNKAAQIQSGTVAVSADTVKLAKETMAKTIIKYSLRGSVKAKQISNLTLSNHLDHPLTYISKAPKNLAVQRAKDLRQHLQDNLTTLTNITAANITEIDAAIAAYDKVKDNPTTDIQARAATGTNPIPAALAQAFEAIDGMHNLVISYFSDTNKAIVDEFTLARMIINTGIHHTGITGTVKKEDAPVMGATVKIANTDKVAVTDIDGHFTISKIKAGDYNVEITTTTGETQSKAAHITRGDFTTVNFTF
jgi:hypothetical protein